MLNASTRTIRGGSNPVFNGALKQDEGLATNRNTVYTAHQPDKSGAHSIAALNRFICDSKNGSTYSDAIKAKIGEKPDPVNPYIPSKQGKVLPAEKFTVKTRGGCGCSGNKPGRPKLALGTPAQKYRAREPFMGGCGDAFVKHGPQILTYGPIAIVVLIVIAALLIAKMIMCRRCGMAVRKTAIAISSPNTMSGGAVDDSVSII